MNLADVEALIATMGIGAATFIPALARRRRRKAPDYSKIAQLEAELFGFETKTCACCLAIGPIWMESCHQCGTLYQQTYVYPWTMGYLARVDGFSMEECTRALVRLTAPRYVDAHGWYDDELSMRNRNSEAKLRNIEAKLTEMERGD